MYPFAIEIDLATGIQQNFLPWARNLINVAGIRINRNFDNESSEKIVSENRENHGMSRPMWSVLHFSGIGNRQIDVYSRGSEAAHKIRNVARKPTLQAFFQLLPTKNRDYRVYPNPNHEISNFIQVAYHRTRLLYQSLDFAIKHALTPDNPIHPAFSNMHSNQKPRPYILAESTWKEVQETPYSVAILPWGATEAHNYHLPYSTDVIQCDVVASESARKAWEQGARPIVLPTVPFGVNTGQLDVKLDINMNPSTQLAVLEDIVSSLLHQGLTKLVILNGHGGNDFRQIARELLAVYPKMFIAVIDWFRVLDPTEFFDVPGDHADEMETSMMLYIAPSLVRPLSEAGSGATRAFKIDALREGWAWTQRDWLKATVDTGVGNPERATAQKGEAYLNAVSEKIGGFLVDLDACDLDDLYEPHST